MKNSKGYLRSLEVFDTSCRHHVFTLGGSAASVANNLLIKQAVRASLSILPSLVADRNLVQLTSLYLSAIKSVDFSEVLETNEKAYRVLIQDWTCFADFKGHFTDREVQILTPVLGSIRNMIELRFYPILRQVNTWLRFLSKLSFTMESLEVAALEDYLQNLTRIRELDLAGNSHIPGIAKIIKSWLSNLVVGPDLPMRHGPGSVAEGSLSKFEKYRALSVDTRLRLCLQCGDYSDDLSSQFPLGYGTKIRRVSRVVFVPKNAKKLRTICAEPCSLQFVQQGVMRVLYKYMRKHPVLSKHIFLHDATRNHDLACVGSVFGTYCTIDLSAASDSVSYDLVKRLFRGTPLYKWLLGTRSDHVELPNGQIEELPIFAPMGSSLCFPIECLVFAAIVEYSTRLRHMHRPQKQWLVYGDDIIVDPSVVRNVVTILESLGFKVNHSKSFTEGPFRESCGKEFYKGVEVTPIYYRISPVADCISPDQYDSICSTINLSGERGFPFLRSYLIDWLRSLRVRLKGRTLRLSSIAPFFTDEHGCSPHVFSPQPTNFHLDKRWDPDGKVWHAWFYRTLGLKPRNAEKVPRDLEDIILYREYLCERHWSPLGDTDVSASYRLAKHDHAFCMVWRPSYSDGGHCAQLHHS